MMVKVPKGKPDEPLEILWEDSCSNDSWNSPDNHGGVLQVMTVGYLLHDFKRSVCVVQNMLGNKNVSCSMTIPKSCITSIKRFRRK